MPRPSVENPSSLAAQQGVHPGSLAILEEHGTAQAPRQILLLYSDPHRWTAASCMEAPRVASRAAFPRWCVTDAGTCAVSLYCALGGWWGGRETGLQNAGPFSDHRGRAHKGSSSLTLISRPHRAEHTEPHRNAKPQPPTPNNKKHHETVRPTSPAQHSTPQHKHQPPRLASPQRVNYSNTVMPRPQTT